jgi:hypothetical protein
MGRNVCRIKDLVKKILDLLNDNFMLPYWCGANEFRALLNFRANNKALQNPVGSGSGFRLRRYLRPSSLPPGGDDGLFSQSRNFSCALRHSAMCSGDLGRPQRHTGLAPWWNRRRYASKPGEGGMYRHIRRRACLLEISNLV